MSERGRKRALIGGSIIFENIFGNNVFRPNKRGNLDFWTFSESFLMSLADISHSTGRKFKHS